MISWFTGLPVWVYAAAGGTLLLFAGYAGWTIRDWKCDAAQVKVIKKEVIRYQKQTQVIQKEADEFESEKVDVGKTQAGRKAKIEIIYKEKLVPVDCSVPDDARRVLEDSIREANSRASGEFKVGLRASPTAPDPFAGPVKNYMGGNYYYPVWGMRF